ncbi:hypothetical protein AB0N89_20290 [Amycolatopsis sp. NPDC089917]|uniref:hypothetical protein n=1 Tax=Amycolatopsis sp. NPDC089917 TaxID=3155187 RepID=UPI003419638B
MHVIRGGETDTVLTWCGCREDLSRARLVWGVEIEARPVRRVHAELWFKGPGKRAERVHGRQYRRSRTHGMMFRRRGRDGGCADCAAGTTDLDSVRDQEGAHRLDGQAVEAREFSEGGASLVADAQPGRRTQVPAV